MTAQPSDLAPNRATNAPVNVPVKPRKWDTATVPAQQLSSLLLCERSAAEEDHGDDDAVRDQDIERIDQ